MKNRTSLSFIIGVALVSSCDYSDATIAGNYYPTTRGSYWTYEVKSNCDWPNQASTCITVRSASATGEELPWDSSYQPFTSVTSPNQFIKVIGHEYYGYGYYLPEYKFLDDRLPVNGSWTNGEEDYRKDVFEIEEVGATKTVSGKTYYDVIVLKNTLYYKTFNQPEPYEVVTTTNRYYARGVGEIYAKITYTLDGHPITTEYFLKDFFIAEEN